VLVAGFAAPTLEGRIDPRDISIERGAAFITPVVRRVPFIYSVHGDDIGLRSSGPLALLENGIPLGPEAASHEQIRSSGGGAYSHWGNVLYWSDGAIHDQWPCYVSRSRGAEASSRHRHLWRARFALLLVDGSISNQLRGEDSRLGCSADGSMLLMACRGSLACSSSPGSAARGGSIRRQRVSTPVVEHTHPFLCCRWPCLARASTSTCCAALPSLENGAG
jgi:hypothetical protein